MRIDLADLILADSWQVQVLRAARKLALPDWAIGAGFVRSAVWDYAHGYREPTPLDDVDVVYFERADNSSEREVAHEQWLARAMPAVSWQVRNQVRMHEGNGDPPYRDTEDALRYWPETATCVAVRLEADDSLTIIAPYGLDDLLSLRARPTARGGTRYANYVARMRAKNWPARWPKVRVEGLP